LIIKWDNRQVVDFETVCHVTYAFSFLVEVRYDDHFVTKLKKTLRQLKYVALHAAHIRIEEIRDHAREIRKPPIEEFNYVDANLL
jgi:hypothetical protein